MAAATLQAVDQRLRSIITNLYMLILQAHDYHGQGTQHAMTDEIKRLIQNLVEVSQQARTLNIPVPIGIIQYIEQSRNPDVYTREFVESVMKWNQQLKGRSEAFAQFRDILAREMMSGIPDIKDDVREIAASTGG
ncbi:RNA polymerase II mediator complex subunit [Recurvomyces mirabilis]|uniref:Mediator of RNA polymerase II transcription subunit 10 n=1 Tax=Recurvomyces mirabilis TaxID=574656 RepID=A0AAE0TMC6_9PEZI|nr:RNA polymerase II mediator complex subunit [Recurvomyces mirabilis]KAK5150520.1 RNA polymerase II mediator complex subunit [Recurvomyces mirabilis]